MLFSELCLLNDLTRLLSRIWREVVLWVWIHFLHLTFGSLIYWSEAPPIFFSLFDQLWKPACHLHPFPGTWTRGHSFWTIQSHTSDDSRWVTMPTLPLQRLCEAEWGHDTLQRVMSIWVEGHKVINWSGLIVSQSTMRQLSVWGKSYLLLHRLLELQMFPCRKRSCNVKPANVPIMSPCWHPGAAAVVLGCPGSLSVQDCRGPGNMTQLWAVHAMDRDMASRLRGTHAWPLCSSKWVSLPLFTQWPQVSWEGL